MVTHMQLLYGPDEQTARMPVRNRQTWAGVGSRTSSGTQIFRQSHNKIKLQIFFEIRRTWLKPLTRNLSLQNSALFFNVKTFVLVSDFYINFGGAIARSDLLLDLCFVLLKNKIINLFFFQNVIRELTFLNMWVERYETFTFL